MLSIEETDIKTMQQRAFDIQKFPLSHIQLKKFFDETGVTGQWQNLKLRSHKKRQITFCHWSYAKYKNFKRQQPR